MQEWSSKYSYYSWPLPQKTRQVSYSWAEGHLGLPDSTKVVPLNHSHSPMQEWSYRYSYVLDHCHRKPGWQVSYSWAEEQLGMLYAGGGPHVPHTALYKRAEANALDQCHIKPLPVLAFKGSWLRVFHSAFKLREKVLITHWSQTSVELLLLRMSWFEYWQWVIPLYPIASGRNCTDCIYMRYFWRLWLSEESLIFETYT